MVAIKIRKIQTSVEEVFHDGGPVAARPLTAIADVARSPATRRPRPALRPLRTVLSFMSTPSPRSCGRWIRPRV